MPCRAAPGSSVTRRAAVATGGGAPCRPGEWASRAVPCPAARERPGLRRGGRGEARLRGRGGCRPCRLGVSQRRAALSRPPVAERDGPLRGGASRAAAGAGLCLRRRSAVSQSGCCRLPSCDWRLRSRRCIARSGGARTPWENKRAKPWSCRGAVRTVAAVLPAPGCSLFSWSSQAFQSLLDFGSNFLDGYGALLLHGVIGRVK